MSAVLLLFLECQKIEIRTLPVGGDDVSEVLAKPYPLPVIGLVSCSAPKWRRRLALPRRNWPQEWPTGLRQHYVGTPRGGCPPKFVGYALTFIWPAIGAEASTHKDILQTSTMPAHCETIYPDNYRRVRQLANENKIDSDENCIYCQEADPGGLERSPA